MKKFIIIVFSLIYGNVPSYIFTKAIGKKDCLIYPDGETDGIPSVFHNGIHAIRVEHQSVADGIKGSIAQFADAGYGEIKQELVESLTDSKIWNKEETKPTPPITKQTEITFSYIDKNMPTPIPTPSITKAGDLNCTVGTSSITLAVDQYTKVDTILLDLASEITKAEGYTAEVKGSTIEIISTEDTPVFVWNITEEVENLIYPTEPIFDSDKKLIIELSYADEDMPLSIPTPSVTEGGTLVYKIDQQISFIGIEKHDGIHAILNKWKTNIDKTEGYTSEIANSTITIKTTKPIPNFEWVDVNNIKESVWKKQCFSPHITPGNLEYTKEIVFQEKN